MTHALLLLALACTEPAAPPVAPSPPAQPPVASGEPVVGGVGATVFVPVWSSVHPLEEHRTIPLSCTLAIRNADATRPIRLASVRYQGGDGVALQEHVPTPREVGPLAAATFVVPEEDTRGGAATSFLVDWSADAGVVDPVVDAVCVGTRGGQGLSFTSEGRVVARRPAAP